MNNSRNLEILNRIEKQQKLKKRFAYEILVIFFIAYVLANFVFVLMFNLILYVWKKKINANTIKYFLVGFFSLWGISLLYRYGAAVDAIMMALLAVAVFIHEK